MDLGKQRLMRRVGQCPGDAQMHGVAHAFHAQQKRGGRYIRTFGGEAQHGLETKHVPIARLTQRTAGVAQAIAKITPLSPPHNPRKAPTPNGVALWRRGTDERPRHRRPRSPAGSFSIRWWRQAPMIRRAASTPEICGASVRGRAFLETASAVGYHAVAVLSQPLSLNRPLLRRRDEQDTAG